MEDLADLIILNPGDRLEVRMKGRGITRKTIKGTMKVDFNFRVVLLLVNGTTYIVDELVLNLFPSSISRTNIN